jgi:hypothetical protein
MHCGELLRWSLNIPEVGALAEDVELTGVHRILLADTQHYVDYRIHDPPGRWYP